VLRQLGNVRRHPPRLIPGEQLGRRAPTGFVLKIKIAERLPDVIAHDEAGVVGLIDRPRWWEAARLPSISDAWCIFIETALLRPFYSHGPTSKFRAAVAFWLRYFRSWFDRLVNGGAVTVA
jgi:hypothetical protein